MRHLFFNIGLPIITIIIGTILGYADLFTDVGSNRNIWYHMLLVTIDALAIILGLVFLVYGIKGVSRGIKNA